MPTRQVKRSTDRKMKKEDETTRKILNQPITKGEYHRKIVELEKHIGTFDLIIASMTKILETKGIITKEDLDSQMKYQAEKLEVMQKICEQSGNYEERLKLCKEYEIHPEMTTVAKQIYFDTELSDDQKIKWCSEYDMQNVLNALMAKIQKVVESQQQIESNTEIKKENTEEVIPNTI